MIKFVFFLFSNVDLRVERADHPQQRQPAPLQQLRGALRDAGGLSLPARLHPPPGMEIYEL